MRELKAREGSAWRSTIEESAAFALAAAELDVEGMRDDNRPDDSSQESAENAVVLERVTFEQIR